MEIFYYCDNCKKKLNSRNFDNKINGDFYKRCKLCRKYHNNNQMKKYVKKKISFNKSFNSYNGKTNNGKLKIDCWHPTKNDKLTPRDVFKSSSKKYWFQCDTCSHDFNSILGDITINSSWCPYCAKQKLCNDKNCDHCFNKSFASYKNKTSNEKLKIDCWHPTKNGKLTPRDVFKSSSKKYWFQCDTCNHDFNSSLNSISCCNVWCHYCFFNGRKLCNDKNCDHCFNKSFASYKNKTSNEKLKIDCWHPTKNGKLTPRDVFKSSSKKYWFQCDTCNHDFNSSLNSISCCNVWCHYCFFNGRKLCNDKNCDHCFNKSFASYKNKTSNEKLKIDCWHPTKNGKLTPRDVFKSSSKKYWFQCDTCNFNFYSQLCNISHLNNWCPNCKNKTELKLYNYLFKQNNIKKIIKEFKPIWCSTKYRYFNKKIKNGKYQYRYDFLIIFNNNKKLIIELDGRQHFKQVSNWKSPMENQIRDKYKELLAKKYKIPLIRCIQEDIYMNKNNWKKKLKKQFKKYS